MSFPAQAFRILIASPADVTEERDLAVRAIQEWNDLHSAERQVVLLPLRWETHSAPEYGRRPQEVINRQVVDHCDILVGVFWTRIGSPTGIAESGTIEEIERAALGGKPVMLYFSQAKQDPDKIEVDQLVKLRDFKKKTLPNSLVEHYLTASEFKDKFTKQIEIQLRSVVASQSATSGAIDSDPLTDIRLRFADPETGADAGEHISLQTAVIEISDLESIPEYRPAEVVREPKRSETLITLGMNEPNKNYYKQKATHLALKSYYRPLRFRLKNAGRIGARDIYIDIRFESQGAPISLINKSKLPRSEPTRMTSNFLMGHTAPSSTADIIDDSREWSASFEVGALQPQRELSPEVEFLLGARADCEVVATATIFADTLPQPVSKTLRISIHAREVQLSAADIVDQDS